VLRIAAEIVDRSRPKVHPRRKRPLGQGIGGGAGEAGVLTGTCRNLGPVFRGSPRNRLLGAVTCGGKCNGPLGYQ
jgi:hypothetical protein